jgi:hypothetical protein
MKVGQVRAFGKCAGTLVKNTNVGGVQAYYYFFSRRVAKKPI